MDDRLNYGGTGRASRHLLSRWISNIIIAEY
jgi:hypothetical protein